MMNIMMTLTVFCLCGSFQVASAEVQVALLRVALMQTAQEIMQRGEIHGSALQVYIDMYEFGSIYVYVYMYVYECICMYIFVCTCAYIQQP